MLVRYKHHTLLSQGNVLTHEVGNRPSFGGMKQCPTWCEGPPYRTELTAPDVPPLDARRAQLTRAACYTYKSLASGMLSSCCKTRD